jgi:hypothetical protein
MALLQQTRSICAKASRENGGAEALCRIKAMYINHLYRSAKGGGAICIWCSLSNGMLHRSMTAQARFPPLRLRQT